MHIQVEIFGRWKKCIQLSSSRLLSPRASNGLRYCKSQTRGDRPLDELKGEMNVCHSAYTHNSIFVMLRCYTKSNESHHTQLIKLSIFPFTSYHHQRQWQQQQQYHQQQAHTSVEWKTVPCPSQPSFILNPVPSLSIFRYELISTYWYFYSIHVYICKVIAWRGYHS